jgi:hypothetical protein
MCVDLKKARAGWTVKFRCGGKAVIKSIEDTIGSGGSSYRYKIHFEESDYPIEKRYQSGGTYRGTDVKDTFDIVELIEPPFDWKDVTPGMAFYNATYGVVYFLGTSRNGSRIFEISSTSFSDIPTPHVNRAPEHDKVRP